MATLIGDGSHARDIWATRPTDNTTGWRQYGHHKEYVPDDDKYVIGVNDPRLRAAICNEIDASFPDIPWIHPDAVIGPGCRWRWGTHINYGVTMTRTTIGHHCTISPGVTICGDVTIGDRVLVGAGATICDRVTIGNDVTIGAGAVVLPETTIPDGETWVGVPAHAR